MKKVQAILCLALSMNLFFACKKDTSSSTPAPTVDFSYSGANVPAPATVSFSSIVTNTTSYLWDFGDNASSTDANPTHTYTAGGVYTVKLTAIGAGGSTSTMKTVNVTTPTSVKITALKITSIPSLDPSCSCGWDSNSGADVYFTLTDNNDVVLLTGNTFSDITSSTNLAWSLTPSYQITNFATNYKVKVYDKDTNDFPSNPDDFMGGYTFNMSPYTSQGYPTKVTLQNSSSQLKIELTLLWQ